MSPETIITKKVVDTPIIRNWIPYFFISGSAFMNPTLDGTNMIGRIASKKSAVSLIWSILMILNSRQRKRNTSP